MECAGSNLPDTTSAGDVSAQLYPCRRGQRQGRIGNDRIEYIETGKCSERAAIDCDRARTQAKTVVQAYGAAVQRGSAGVAVHPAEDDASDAPADGDGPVAADQSADRQVRGAIACEGKVRSDAKRRTDGCAGISDQRDDRRRCSIADKPQCIAAHIVDPDRSRTGGIEE